MDDGTSRCRIYLVRHGTTLLNRTNRYRGRIDIPLDEGGWQDAWAVAGRLSEVSLDAVYASPLRRARDTARVIADAAGITVVQDLPGLLNLACGRWDGLTPQEAARGYPREYAAYQDYAPGAATPQGESLDLAAQRMLLSLRLLASLHPGGSVAAVSHAATVRLTICHAVGGPRPQWRRVLPNGGLTVFDATPKGVTAVEVPGEVAAVE